MAQLSIFEVVELEPEESAEERERRYFDLIGRAFEAECSAAECRSDLGRARMLAQAKAYLSEADAIVRKPIETR